MTDEKLNQIYSACQALIEARDFDRAISKLSKVAANDKSGNAEALLGVAHFCAERYEEALPHFQRAVDLDNSRADWKHQLDVCQANSIAKVDAVIPDIYYFDREEILAPPPDPKLPKPPEPVVLPYQLHKLRYLRPFIGRTLGLVGSGIFNFLTVTLGSRYNGKTWTNWYQKSKYPGVFTLAFMREKLNADNLKNTYPKNAKIAFQPDGLKVPEGVTHFRTADGSWNNLDNPKEGAAHTRFQRNVENKAIKPEDDILNPNPRLVSLKLLTRGEKMREVPFLNMLAASWIQFMNSDWISHGENTTEGKIEIPFAEDDPARKLYHQSSMLVNRTQPDPSYKGPEVEETPITFANDVTHWWDGSQIYGSDQETQDRLRSHVGGRLKLQADGRLPLNNHGSEDTGFNRNWWLGQAMLHNVFAREHNAICDMLKYNYPDWDDNRLFNVARLINAAVMAKIHSVEWTPAVLPNELLTLALNSNWYGVLTYMFRSDKKRKTVASFNINNPELGGLVGNTINKHDCPFGLTQEFVEIYRLHSFLPETLQFRNHNTDELIEEVPFVASRQAGSPKITNRIDMADLFYSFGKQHPGALELNNYPHFMQELSIPGSPVYDMGAIDILRARERGVPRYNEFRRQLGLKPISKFEDLTDDAQYVAKIKEVYGGDVEKLDLLVGTLAEGHRPTHFGFGETMFQIFILNASRRLQSDRFYTTDYREEVYTSEGMKWIDDSSFKSVILRHYPDLEKTGLGNIKNAFEPWDPESRLNLERHPLRAYDKELRNNPRHGDAYPISRVSFMTIMGKITNLLEVRRWKTVLVLLVLLVLIEGFSSPQIQQIFQLTTAPDLPPLKEFERVLFLSGAQNWDADPVNPDLPGPITHEYHHKSQGTSTFPIPYKWMMALEEPAANLFTMPFSSRGKFISNDYFPRYGFIPSKVSDQNPDGLPIGLAKTRYEYLEGIDNTVDVLGFTCAACHTGQIEYNNTQFIIEGAPATADFGNVIVGLGAAIGQTLASSYVPVLNGRWERFARAALEPDGYTPENVARLQSQLFEVVVKNFQQPNEVDVVEGFTRTDALNRIGNRVFAIDADRFDNYAAVDAPVNYPHIWTTSWFKWVQYDASIMQPLYRNLGEALGVYANVGLDSPSEEGRFYSAVPLENLVWIEDWLKGPENPSYEKKFAGLLAPKWPEQFPEINMTRAAAGERLYKELCVRCHLPPINGQLTDSQGQPQNPADFFEESIWDYFEPISWWKGNEKQPDSEPVLNLKVIPDSVVGTDPATGSVLKDRKVTSSGFEGRDAAESSPGMEIKQQICVREMTIPKSPWDNSVQASVESLDNDQDGPKLVDMEVTDSPNGSYAYLLGALVQAVANEWFKEADYPDEVKSAMMGNRPNCFQAGMGYKARPHDGIWATAPFLHNGSVPTLWDLLSPVADRPKYVVLGDIEFDDVKVGLVQPENVQPRAGTKYNRDGYFVLDTTIPGNLNIGHEFRGDGKGGKGVIGRGLTDAERYDLIEYLKTL